MSNSSTRYLLRRNVAAVPAMVAILLALSACSVVNGSGHVATETRQVSGFTGITLAGSGEVTITQGDTESLTIEADDNLLPKLTSEVSGSMLTLDTKLGTTVRSLNPIRYRVTVKNLATLSLSGSGSVNAQNLKLRVLETDISGSGRVNLSGSAEELDIEISGSGRYEATELPSQKVIAEISGSGSAVVTVSGELHADISGSGNITYSGEPTVDSSVSGSGKVIKK